MTVFVKHVHNSLSMHFFSMKAAFVLYQIVVANAHLIEMEFIVHHYF